MQKLLKRFFMLSVLVLAVLSTSSCILFTGLKALSESGNASINGEKVNIKTLGSPETHCLSFYYLKVKPETMYIQCDSSKTAIYTTPLSLGDGYYCFPPFETDLSFQLSYMWYDNFWTKTTTTFSPGLGTNGNISFITRKTGLYFIGAYDFKTEGTAGALVPLPRDKQANYELKCLNKLKSKLKNTAWLPLIEARIEELKNEKK
ncbi:hypothetical protein [Treponema pedis]|uniref:hypothetical protein n=1 Tax=Treponema pedis TaxID=409322 RepID=UPI000403E75E|nr:hypothetical protein [Treponema pedis]QSI05847.1 hypothetical protein DYQ05_13505 [Treponema pedis]